MSRRASLPGADELFRRTTERPDAREAEQSPQVTKSTKLQVATTPEESAPEVPKKAPRHDEKITFYCTSDDLMAIESARLTMRSKHGVAADRGKIVRAALAYVLEDFAARREDSILLHRLSD
ncbi:MAG: hypothetical protein ACR2KQ_10500 [Actinomycetota bacterium]